MRLIHYVSLSMLVAATMIAGCSKPTPVSSDGTDVIMPLKVGNRWIGRWSFFDSTGVISSTRLDTVTVLSEEMIGSEKWFRVDGNVLRTNRTDGYWAQGSLFGPNLMAKYPAAIGDTFGTDYFLQTFPDGSTGEMITYYLSVVSTSTSVTVPAGTFICHEYKSNYSMPNGVMLDNQEERYYYAPGKGMIKSEEVWFAPGGKIVMKGRWELVELDLK
jgi:hypothetical protein